ncbi:hypothetical protein JTE90_021181 [Oedothorax gibbosus]|uniref:Uncharacterized protein n=1 Tax=Oedothorax gibbosus TaxID=931172 RepID=A0AAV6V4I7_9ARAC|nr:hypothetical protein JTE90_021181 [Oedothorax gibbosus]
MAARCPPHCYPTPFPDKLGPLSLSHTLGQNHTKRFLRPALWDVFHKLANSLIRPKDFSEGLSRYLSIVSHMRRFGADGSFPRSGVLCSQSALIGSLFG